MKSKINEKMKPKLYTAETGSKIEFKPMRLEEVLLIHAYASDEDVSRYIGWKLMHTLDETTAYVKEMMRREDADTHLYASIYEKDSGVLIGTGMLFNFDEEARQAEIGYVFHKGYWGKGYASEAIKAMTTFAGEQLGLHKVHASVVAANTGSARVLEKNGYVLEGRLRDHFFIDGAYDDALLFGKIF
jgi:ribosomal-protein-alanine N-acetyltransferase